MQIFPNHLSVLRFISRLLLIAVALPALSSAAIAHAADGDFLWAKAVGGTSGDVGRSVAVDNSGNSYITGSFRWTADFDTGAGISMLESAGNRDIFVCKLDSKGDLLWARAMGDTLEDEGHGISVDAFGNVYITGYIQGSVDFGGGLVHSAGGSKDIFVCKLDSNGNFLWARTMGDTADDAGRALSVDASGNVYITGSFEGAVNFGGGVVNSASGSPDIFVCKLDGNGDFLWAQAMGGPLFDNGSGIFVDAAANVHITGSFQGIANFGGGGMPPANGSDIFVCKLTSDGAFIWARTMGGGQMDHGTGIAVDAFGNVYTTGSFQGAVDFGGGFVASVGGSEDIFINKLDSSGEFVWGRAMGGMQGDSGNGIAVDTSGNVYTTGAFDGSVDFGGGVVNNAGGRDIFVSKLDGNGDCIWARSMGGSAWDFGYGIAVDASANLYTTGSFEGTSDFDPGAGSYMLDSASIAGDIFVVKLSGPIFPWSMILPAIIGNSE